MFTCDALSGPLFRVKRLTCDDRHGRCHLCAIIDSPMKYKWSDYVERHQWRDLLQFHLHARCAFDGLFCNYLFTQTQSIYRKTTMRNTKLTPIIKIMNSRWAISQHMNLLVALFRCHHMLRHTHVTQRNANNNLWASRCLQSNATHWMDCES